MLIFTMILLLAVIALGTDAIVYNGTYSQGVWRKLSDYTLESYHGVWVTGQSGGAA